MSNRKSLGFVTALAGGASLIALAQTQPALAQQGAQADQPSASSSGGLEEIVVTARRKEEKAQSVPIAISNVSTSQLEEQRVLTPSELTKEFTGFSTITNNRSVAGLQAGGAIGNSYQWIRGIAGVVPYWADAPTVANAGSLFDVSSVQVLKGPQGTLFGQATNGGAIVYQPKLPTNVFEGFVEAEVGDYNHTRLGGLVNIPIIDDVLLVRIGGRKNHTDGYVYDIAHKTWTSDENNQVGRLAVTIRPTDDIQNDFIGNAFSYKEIPGLNQATNVYTGGVPTVQNLNTRLPYAQCNAVPFAQANACVATYSTLGWYATPGDPNYPVAGLASGWINMAVNTTRWDVLDNLTLKNIASYSEVQVGQAYGGTPFATTLAPSAFGQDLHSWPNGPGVQGTEEFQVLGKAFNDKLSYTAGVFYLFSQGVSAPHQISIQCARVSNGTTNPLGVLAGGTATSCSGTQSYTNDRSQAVYAQGTYDLGDYMDGLSITGGIRYTWDKAYSSNYAYSGTPQNGPNKPQVITGVIAGWGTGEGSHATSYNISVDWQIDPKTLIYVTNSKGFSKGGLTPVTNLVPQARAYGPESLNNIEGGIKADWDLPLDMKARTNISYFYGLYDNAQVQKNVNFPDVFGNPAVSVITANAASGHVDGVDFDLTLLPTDDISLSGGGVWVEHKYDDYPFCAAYVGLTTVCQAGQLYDLKKSIYVIAPKWTWHFRAGYVLPLDESLGKVTFAANVSHVGPYYSSVGPNPPAYGWPSPTRGDYDVPTNFLDLSVSWTSFLGRKGLDGHAYVNNITNAHVGLGQVVNEDQNSYKSTPVAIPRSWGVGLRYAFGP